MVREEMAKLMWSRLDVPVRSALLAAALYRKWSVLPDIKPHVQMHMADIAQHFEDLAVDVQKVAMRQDAKLALTSLERKSRLWKGQTGVDLALLGSCHSFLEQCCSQALDYRWSGDLHPYNQTLGLYPSVTLCLLTGGLLAPNMLTYRDPPAAEAIRPPTQRIRIPEGGKRHEERGNESLENIFFKLQKVQASNAVTYDSREVREFTSDDLDDIGDTSMIHHESISWTERYCLFFMCPITIFIIDAMIQITVNIAFMTILFTSDPNRQALTTLEIALATLQLSTSISELVQAYVDGYSNYSQAGMNWVKMIGIFFFWLGFCGHVLRPYMLGPALDGLDHGLQGHGMRLLMSLGLHKHADMAYSISLFFMWMMVLNIISVRKDLGPLVSVFARMGSDMLTFGAIWIILLLGFSCAMQGTGINDDHPECYLPHAGSGGLGAGGEGGVGGEAGADGEGFEGVIPAPHHAPSVTPMSCWSTWWILRTYYQAFGQPFFEELRTDEANVITVIMWPVMNLMLVNLLIAIMNDSYSDVKQHSKLEWMIKMFHMAKEYRSTSRLNVVLLTYDVSVFWWTKKEIDSRLKKLIGQRMPGLRSYIEDVRIKFKKFQCRDLPAVDIAEQKHKYEEAIELLGQDDSEASLDARVFKRIKQSFHKELSKARAAEQVHQKNQRKNRLMRSAADRRGGHSMPEALLINTIYCIISIFSFVALPITMPLSAIHSAVQSVQDTLKPRKPSTAERAELRNDLIRQLWILSKTIKLDSEVLRRIILCC